MTICQDALLHLAILAIGFEQQDGERRVAIGDGFDVHGDALPDEPS